MRTGLADIVTELRTLTAAGTADYSMGTVTYWSDDQLQTILDNHRTDLNWYEMTVQPGIPSNGVIVYTNYSVGYSNLEQTSGGTAVFIVQDILGNAVDATTYAVDYNRGLVTFLSNTLGLDYFVTARSFDLDGAAAEVWRKKQVHYHTAVNFSTDNHSVSREALYRHAQEMAEYYESRGGEGMETVSMLRSDSDAV